MIFKTTEQIFSDLPGLLAYDPIRYPMKEHLVTSKFSPCIKNVKTWEQIYYKKNYISVYASWNPYVEYYIITLNLFLNSQNSYEEYYGLSSKDDVVSRCKMLGINLDEKFIFVEDIDLKNFNHT